MRDKLDYAECSCIADPVKEIKKGDGVIICLNTSMVVAGTYVGCVKGGFIIKNTAVIQAHPVMVEGKRQIQLVFSLPLPEGACNKIKCRYTKINESMVLDVEKMDEKTFDDFCNHYVFTLEDKIFKETMTPQQMENQDKFYEALVREFEEQRESLALYNKVQLGVEADKPDTDTDGEEIPPKVDIPQDGDEDIPDEVEGIIPEDKCGKSETN